MTASNAGSLAPGLADLEAVLVPLVPALERLHGAQLEQRRLVVAGDLGAMVSVNATIEETSARIAGLEHRRQMIQSQLEAELGVHGLRAVLKAAQIPSADRSRLGALLVQVARMVRELREQGRQNAELLAAAVDLARRTRLTLERLSGVESTYDPVKARRLQAARRARATLAAAATVHPPAPGSQDSAPATEAP